MHMHKYMHFITLSVLIVILHKFMIHSHIFCKKNLKSETKIQYNTELSLNFLFYYNIILRYTKSTCFNFVVKYSVFIIYDTIS